MKTKALRNKLRHIIETMGLSKNKFNEFHLLIKKWHKLIDIRDSIAHGGKPDQIDLPEAMYTILFIIFTIGIQEDLINSDWEAFLLEENGER